MDERRLERALRQGPPFATRYVPSSLALDEGLVVDRTFGVGRLALLIAVTALLLVGMLAGLAATGALRDDDRDNVGPERGFVEPFIGLPPAGAPLSTPATGELVLSFYGRVSTTEDVHGIWVYADGRLIWRRNLDDHVSSDALRRGFGAAEPTRAVIEQRLTPEGVELLRSEVISAGLAGLGPVQDTVPAYCYRRAYWGLLAVRDGGQLVRGAWCDNELPDRLADFASWLPASAWADQRIGGYVPSRYALCIDPMEEQARVIERIPEAIRSLLESRAAPIVQPDADPGCVYEVTTDDARAIAAVLDDAGLEQEGFSAWVPILRYAIPSGAVSEREGFVAFVSILPNGELVEYRQ
jgi:hypothetical protein